MRIIQSASVGSLAAAGPAKAPATIKANAAMRMIMDNDWPRVRSRRHPLPLAARRLGPSQPVITSGPSVGTLAGLALHPLRLLALVARAPELRPLLAGGHVAFGLGGLPLGATGAQASHHGRAAAGGLRGWFGGRRRCCSLRLRR